MVESRGRMLSATLPDTLDVRGDADDLRDALRNLLENAVLHGSGRIGLDGRMDGEQGHVVMCVSDEGRGFEPAGAAAVFERFHKGSRSVGMGLGLAIVREVLRSHGGDVVALPGPPGRIELRLPAAV
jgi:two-component system sensor histidine kinase QseC